MHIKSNSKVSEIDPFRFVITFLVDVLQRAGSWVLEIELLYLITYEILVFKKSYLKLMEYVLGSIVFMLPTEIIKIKISEAAFIKKFYRYFLKASVVIRVLITLVIMEKVFNLGLSKQLLNSYQYYSFVMGLFLVNRSMKKVATIVKIKLVNFYMSSKDLDKSDLQLKPELYYEKKQIQTRFVQAYLQLKLILTPVVVVVLYILGYSSVINLYLNGFSRVMHIFTYLAIEWFILYYSFSIYDWFIQQGLFETNCEEPQFSINYFYLLLKNHLIRILSVIRKLIPSRPDNLKTFKFTSNFVPLISFIMLYSHPVYCILIKYLKDKLVKSLLQSEQGGLNVNIFKFSFYDRFYQQVLGCFLTSYACLLLTLVLKKILDKKKAKKFDNFTYLSIISSGYYLINMTAIILVYVGILPYRYLSEVYNFSVTLRNNYLLILVYYYTQDEVRDNLSMLDQPFDTLLFGIKTLLDYSKILTLALALKIGFLYFSLVFFIFLCLLKIDYKNLKTLK